jgi:hypothetical protein
LISSASARTTILTDKTALLIDQALMTAVRAFLTFGLSSVCHILLKRTLHTILPGIDTFAFQLQRGYEFDDMVNRHAITEHTGYQFGIVPIFGIELLRKSFDCSLITTFVLKLEVIALGSIGIDMLDNLTMGNGLGQNDSLVIIL